MHPVDQQQKNYNLQYYSRRYILIIYNMTRFDQPISSGTNPPPLIWWADCRNLTVMAVPPLGPQWKEWKDMIDDAYNSIRFAITTELVLGCLSNGRLVRFSSSFSDTISSTVLRNAL